MFIYCKVRATLPELLTSHQEGLSLPFLSSDSLFTRAITSPDVTCLYLEVWTSVLEICLQYPFANTVLDCIIDLQYWAPQEDPPASFHFLGTSIHEAKSRPGLWVFLYQVYGLKTSVHHRDFPIIALLKIFETSWLWPFWTSLAWNASKD